MTKNISNSKKLSKDEIIEQFNRSNSHLYKKHKKQRKHKSSFGLELCRERSKIRDELITRFSENFGFSELKGVSIVAIGGYGRYELCPHSDIDLLFLYKKGTKSLVKELVEKLVYFLWDLKLDIGHSVRTIEECKSLSYDEDTTVLTSMMDCHHIHGDESLHFKLNETIYNQVLPKISNKFIERKLDEIERRVKKFGSSVYLLEPNIKEGEGGLRDLQSALWIAQAKFKVRNLHGLLEKGIINSKEYRVIERLHNFFLSIRSELHYQTGKREDRLGFELQEKLAEMFEYQDSKFKAVEKFMRVYYLRARLCHLHSRKIIDECVKTTTGAWNFFKKPKQLDHNFIIKEGCLSTANKNIFKEDPINLIRAFEYIDKYNLRMTNHLRWMIWENTRLIDDNIRINKDFNNIFLRILKHGKNVANVLFLMNELRVLAHYIPEFGKIVCMVQHNAYHVYTVDVHSIMVVQEMEKLVKYKYEEEFQLLTKVAESVIKRDVLYLAGLFHDIGKGLGKNHSEKGAVITAKIAERMGLDNRDVKQLEFLVRHHVIMSDLSQRRDIHDLSMIERLTHMLRSMETLNLLYLLTFADIRSVGPEVWTTWKDMLLKELYLRTSKCFEASADYTGKSIRERRNYVIGKTLNIVENEITKEELCNFIDKMPVSYLYAHTPKSIANHVRIASKAVSEITTGLVHYPKEDYDEFIFWGKDEKGLIYKICGVLSSSNVNILGARITTTKDGRALDVFYVNKLGRSTSDQQNGMWKKIDSKAKDVLEGNLSVDELVKKQMSDQPLFQKTTPRHPPEIEIDNDSSEHSTVIDIYAHDRTGLLYNITKRLNKLGLNINYAKISTKADQAADVFYVSDKKGEKIFDSKRIDKIKNALMESLMN